MFKHVFLTLTALFAFSAVGAMEKDGIYLPAGKTLEEVQQAKKEVAWSTYNSLAQRLYDSNALTYATACAKHPLCTASLLARYPFAWVASKIVGPVSLIKVLAEKEQFKPYTSGEGYVQYFNRCGEHSLATIAQTAAYLCRPTPATAVVEDLYKRGVVQRVASNIGANMLLKLATRFKEVYNTALFAILKTGQVVDYSDFGPDKTVPNLNGGGFFPIKTTKSLQPNQGFYDDFDKTFNPQNDHITVSVCDNEDMLKAAAAHAKGNWAGVHYDVKTSTVEQLRERLAKLGLPAQK